MAQIRNTAADAISLAVGGQGNAFKRINWSEPIIELKGNVQDLRMYLGLAAR